MTKLYGLIRKRMSQGIWHRLMAVCLLAALTAVITGCGAKEQNSSEKKSMPSQEQTDQRDGQDVAVDDERKEPYELNYVDAYGEHFTATINPDLKMHAYDWSKLVREGESGVSYEGDPRFTIRKGVDISKNQGDVDWAALKEAGFEFVFIKIAARAYGEKGQLLPDEAFQKNIEGAQAAGLDAGVYFFSQAINEEEAIEEADLTIRMLKGYTLQLPVVFDPETIRDDTARTDNVSGEQFTKNAIAFCEHIRAAGYEPMIYSNMVWEDQFFEMERLQDYPIWYADYEKTPQTPYDFTFWQYSEKGEAPGVSGIVDLNIQFLKK